MNRINTARLVLSVSLIVFSILFSACKKNDTTNNNNTGPGGTQYWTFKQITYNTDICILNGSQLEASNLPSFHNYSTLSLTFLNPPVAGTYNVINNVSAQAADQVYLALIYPSGTIYYSTGGNGHEQITVSVSGGKVTASGSGIELSSNVNPADSASLNFNVTQTQ